MRIARIVCPTEAEGPGIRMALWVQGCDILCPGCYAKELQDPDKGREVSAREILLQYDQCRGQGLEGITLLGGEPTNQAAELSVLCGEIKKRDGSVILFTGKYLEELRRDVRSEIRKLLRYADVVIDGPYMREKRDFSRPLVGSSNQGFHFQTDRYCMEDFEKAGNRVEIRITPEGILQANGMADFEMLEKVLEGTMRGLQ